MLLPNQSRIRGWTYNPLNMRGVCNTYIWQRTHIQIYKEVLQIIKSKSDDSMEKWAKDWTDTSPKKTSKRLIATWDISHQEMQNKIFLRTIYITNILAKIQKLDNTSISKDAKQLELSYSAEKDVNCYNHFDKCSVY